MQVIERVLRDVREGRHRGVVVDSPPGAGKSTLVVRAADELAATGDPLIIVAQTNEQVDDLVDRLARKAPELRIGRLSAADYQPTERIKGHATVRVAAKVADLGGPAVTIGTARQVGHRQPRAPGRGRSSTRRTRCARTRCCAWPGGSSGRCSSATPGSSTRSPPSRPPAGPA